ERRRRSTARASAAGPCCDGASPSSPASRRRPCGIVPAQMPPSVESASRINLRWIVRLRWGAVAGQVITILFASRILREALPVGPLLAVCGALALVNLVMHVWLLRGGNPTERTAGLNLLGDVLALTALLALSGGAYNPFAVLYLVHITIGAVVLPPRWSIALTATSIAAYTLLQLMPEGPLL